MKAHFNGCDIAVVQDVANRNGLAPKLSIYVKHGLISKFVVVEGHPADVMKFVGAMGQEGKIFLTQVDQ